MYNIGRIPLWSWLLLLLNIKWLEAFCTNRSCSYEIYQDDSHRRRRMSKKNFQCWVVTNRSLLTGRFTLNDTRTSKRNFRRRVGDSSRGYNKFQRTCGKVTFSKVCVILSTWRSLNNVSSCLAAWSLVRRREGVCLPGPMFFWGFLSRRSWWKGGLCERGLCQRGVSVKGEMVSVKESVWSGGGGGVSVKPDICEKGLLLDVDEPLACAVRLPLSLQRCSCTY